MNTKAVNESKSRRLPVGKFCCGDWITAARMTQFSVLFTCQLASGTKAAPPVCPTLLRPVTLTVNPDKRLQLYFSAPGCDTVWGGSEAQVIVFNYAQTRQLIAVRRGEERGKKTKQNKDPLQVREAMASMSILLIHLNGHLRVQWTRRQNEIISCLFRLSWQGSTSRWLYGANVIVWRRCRQTERIQPRLYIKQCHTVKK